MKSKIFTIAAIFILMLYSGMFACPAIAALARAKSEHHCGHEQQRPADQQMIACCDQQAIAVKQYRPAPDHPYHPVLLVAEPLTGPAGTVEPKTHFAFQSCRIARRLATLSILRV